MVEDTFVVSAFSTNHPIMYPTKLNLRGRKVCDGVVFSPYAGFVNDLSIFYPIEQQAL